MPGRVPGEEDTVLGGAAQLMGDPVALVAVGGQAEVGGEADGRLLDVVGGSVGADADAQLVTGGEAPGVAGADVLGVDPQLQLPAVPVRVHLQAT